MVENSSEQDTSREDNNFDSEPVPEDNPFINGDREEPSVDRDKSAGYENSGSMDFLVFLILILLLMGNTNSFNTHFQLINKEVKKVTKLLEAVSATNDSLQDAVKAPQKVMQSFDSFNH